MPSIGAWEVKKISGNFIGIGRKDFLNEDDLNYRVWKSEPGMTAVTHSLMTGLLATTATGAPPVIFSCHNLDGERGFGRDFRTCHDFLPVEETMPEILCRFCVTIT